jgi:hypothetical protein
MPRDSRENQLSIYTYCIWLEFGVNVQLCLGDRDFNIVLDSKVLHSGFNSPEVQFNHSLLPPADRMAAPHLLFHSRDMMIVVLANHLYWLYIKLKFALILNFI